MSTRSPMAANHGLGPQSQSAAEPKYECAQPASLIRYLTDQAQHAIERADTKVSTLAATATAIIAILAQRVGFSARGQWATQLLSAGAIVWAAGIGLLATAIFPRFRATGTSASRLMYFNDFSRNLDGETVQTLAWATPADRDQLLLAQVHALSRIAAVEFRLIRVGMLLLACGGALGLPGVLVR